MPSLSTTNSYLQRLIGAMSLNAAIYEEVEADRTATGQALATVLLSSVAAGIGSRGIEAPSLTSIIFISTVSLIAWVAWALLTFEIGGRLMPEPQTRVDAGELLRTIGFAASPGILRFFRFIPFLGPLLSFVVGIWIVAAMIIAIRQALDYKSIGRAAVVCLIAWFVSILMGIVFGAMLLMSAGSLFY